MKRFRSYRKPIMILAIAAVDALIIFDAFSLAYILRFRFHFLATDFLEPAPVGEYLKAMVVVAYFWILLFKIFGLYDITRHRSAIDIVHHIVKAVSFGTIIILSLTFFYRHFSFSRLVCAYAWFISILLFSVFRLSTNLLRNDWFRRGRDLREVVVVGSRSLARFIVEKTRRQPELGYRVVGCVDTARPQSPVPDCPYLGDLSALETALEQRPVQGVLIANSALGQFDLLNVIQSCEKRDLEIRMVPPTYDLQVNYKDLEEVGGIPLVKINEQECRRLDDLLKRILDVSVASIALMLSLPLWAVVAILIKLEDGGPVFFRQVRVGRNGKRFGMWKFRTMVLDAESLLPDLVNVKTLKEPVFKLEQDPRVTRVGRFLRRTSLDELPQVINVLIGDMSLVGPRPEEERLVQLYNIWERRRLKAFPGITGLQQVMCRGDPSLQERVNWDILYLRKRSVLLDLWILAKTIWVVVSGKGAT